MGDRLPTIDIGRKLGVVPLLFLGGELGPHLTQCGRGRGLPPCQVSFSSVQPFGHNTPTQRHRQTDRQDNGPIAYERTVLQTVAQKPTPIIHNLGCLSERVEE